MPETKPKLTPLAVRKQLLLLESDLNRARLVETLDELRQEFHHSKERLAQLGSMASTAAKVVATVSSARRILSRRGLNGKKSWLSFLFDGMTTGTSLWYLFRSNRRKDED
jgi:hypothetical protein